MSKRRAGLFDDFDEDEFLSFMQEEEEAGSGVDDYEADELRLFLREEGDRRGTARAKSPQQEKRRRDRIFDTWDDFPALHANRNAASLRNPDQISAEKAKTDRNIRTARERYEKECERTEALLRKTVASQRPIYERIKQKELSGEPLSDSEKRALSNCEGLIRKLEQRK